MKGRVQIRRRLTSGNIRDPDLHQQRLLDIERRRDAFWTITLVLTGGVAFATVAVVMSLTG